MRDYELTERGKIVIAVLIAVVLLALAVVLTVKAFASQAPQPPGNQDSAISNPVSPPPTGTQAGTPAEIADEPPDAIPDDPPPETPDDPPPKTTDDPPAKTPDDPPPKTTDSPPPSGGGFNPPDDPEATNGREPAEINPPPTSSAPDDSAPPDGQDNPTTPGSGPTGSDLTEGMLSFLFSPSYQDELDAETASMLGALLGSPRNTRNSNIAVATPRLTDEASATLMAAVKSAFGAHGVPEQRIMHIENSTGIAGETFEVSFYFIPSSGK